MENFKSLEDFLNEMAKPESGLGNRTTKKGATSKKGEATTFSPKETMAARAKKKIEAEAAAAAEELKNEKSKKPNTFDVRKFNDENPHDKISRGVKDRLKSGNPLLKGSLNSGPIGESPIGDDTIRRITDRPPKETIFDKIKGKFTKKSIGNFGEEVGKDSNKWFHAAWKQIAAAVIVTVLINLMNVAFEKNRKKKELQRAEDESSIRRLEEEISRLDKTEHALKADLKHSQDDWQTLKIKARKIKDKQEKEIIDDMLDEYELRIRTLESKIKTFNND
jgi:uncharacterized membrane-anchored protein YhcB (DUF1043 family)